MSRLFTGIPIKTNLAPLQKGLEEIDWVEESDFHITLKFIGDVSAQMANDIDEELRAHYFSSMTLEFSELAWFGSTKPRLLYIGIKPNRELSELAHRHENLMRRMGLPPETRNFMPHVTLAKVKGVSSLELMDYKLMHGVMKFPPVHVSGFSLYGAKEKTGGGPYQRLIDYA
jgi:RNA 2',3'-cyclic 3'-phosphodiesterase